MRPFRPYYVRRSRLDPHAGEVASWIEPAARTAYVAKGVGYGALCVLEAFVLFGEGGVATGGLEGAPLYRALSAPEPLVRSLFLVGAAAFAVYVAWRVAQSFLDPEGRGRRPWALAVRLSCMVSGVVYGWLALVSARIALGAPPSDLAAVAGALEAAAGPGGSGWLAGLVAGAVTVRGIAEMYLAAKPYLPQEIRLAGLRGRQAGRVLALGRTALALRGGALALLGGVLLVTTPAAGPALQETATLALEVLTGERGGWLLAVLVPAGSLYAAYQLAKGRYRLIGEF